MLLDRPATLMGVERHSLTRAVQEAVVTLNRLRRDPRLEPDERNALDNATVQAALAASMVEARKR